MKIKTLIIITLMMLTMVVFPAWEYRTLYKGWLCYTTKDSAILLAGLTSFATWMIVVDIWAIVCRKE